MPIHGGGAECQIGNQTDTQECTTWIIGIYKSKQAVYDSEKVLLTATTDVCQKYMMSGVNPANYFMRLNTWQTIEMPTVLNHPWLTKLRYKKFKFETENTYVADIKLTSTTIQTSKYKLGLGDTSPETTHHLTTSWSTGEWEVESQNNCFLVIRFIPGEWSLVIGRSYPTIVDTLSGIGGVVDIALILLACVYAGYNGYWFDRDLVSKGVMIYGKYGLEKAERKDLESRLQDRTSIATIKSSVLEGGKKVFCFCCRKHQPVGVEEMESRWQRQACENIAERQMDLKHVLQLFQDVELIKRIIYKERH